MLQIFNFKFQISNSSRGFTLIELVATIFIVSIAVIGIFNALSVVIILTADASDRLTATYLSQEGMEIVRNIRDANWLNMNESYINGGTYSWVDGLTQEGVTSYAPDCASTACEADYTSEYLNSTENYLSLNPDGFYSYNLENGTPTKFKRKIKVEPIVDVDDNADYHILKVTSQVSWDKKATILSPTVKADKCCPGGDGCPGLVSNCITTVETLYNWYNTIISVTGVIITDEDGNKLDDSELIPINPEGTYQLLAEISPSNADNQNVVWSSDNTDIATVDNNGLVTAVSQGSATITVNALDGNWSARVIFQVLNP